MYRLSSIIFALLVSMQIFAQSPHGEALKIDCAKCHNPESWSISFKKIEFDHEKLAEFALEGAHKQVDCKQCHSTLVFNEAKTDCVSCHKDMHSGSVGNDCVRCHTSNSWVVDNIPELHEENGFALTGSHSNLSCTECHKSETNLRFDKIGNECISCHRDDYLDSENPNHISANYATSCTDCHNPLATAWTPATFDHEKFPLTLGHEVQDCNKCHTTALYADTSSECISCHQNDFNKTTNPNHESAQFSTDCVSCHTTNPGWTPSSYDHNIFPLTLGHDVQDCNECHKTTNYSDATSECVSCHKTDFDNTSNPNHASAEFSTDCASCHTTSPDWNPSTYDHPKFSLTLGHDIEECNKCHTTTNYSDISSECISCHKTTFDNTINPNHNTIKLSADCTSCHNTEPGWALTNFNVHDEYYPLTGAHATVATDCVLCHNNDYNNTPNTCVGCHQTNFDAAIDPNHKNAGFSTDCATCHTTNPDWTPANWNHDFFPLTLAHDIQDCNKCHTTSNYADTSSECVSCHQDKYLATTNPKHDSAGFPKDCILCHTTNPDWTSSNWNHDIFPRTLGHDIQDCNKCHTNNNYLTTSSECISCHQTDFNTTQIPNHASTGFSTDCKTCHTTNPNWTPTNWSHDFFPLTLAHDIKDCKQCHKTENYRDTSSECVSCHQTDFNATINPNHASAGFSTDCTTCHTTSPNWTPVSWKHDFFPLTLGHDIEDCTKCHTNNNYLTTSSECVSCHQSDFNATVNPNHNNAGFSTDCKSCHTTRSNWNPTNWKHDFFPLTLAHDLPNCNQCHTTANFADASSECVSCHQSDFNNTTNPNHISIGFSTNCVTCHTTNPNWTPSTFNHNNFYPLNGAHAAIATDCASCHKGNYTTTPNTCVGCHLADFNSTTNPNHSTSKFSTDCTSCHTEGSWVPSTFNHDFFPLTLGHATPSCTQCHTTGNYADASPNCVTCHQTDFNTTTNPNHVSAGFPTDCVTCHTTNPNWTPTTFNHNSFYPLNGAHAAIANNCATCHNGNYTTTPNTCVGCHLTDFNSTTNPNHSTLKFSTDCITCHTEGSWTPSTFNHDGQYFPIYSGNHKGEWNACTDCHTNTSNYAVFTCITCHEHNNKTSVDKDHQGVRNYAYNSNACYTCHPDGKD